MGENSAFIIHHSEFRILTPRPRSTMDSIRVSEAPDTGSIPVEATKTKSRIAATLFIKPYHHH